MHGDPLVKLPLVKMIEQYGLQNYYAVLLANNILDKFDLNLRPCKECGRPW